MQLKNAIAVLGICLFGLIGQAWAATPKDASAECVSCHDEEDLSDMSKSVHAERAKKPPMAAAQAALVSRPMGDLADSKAPTCIDCHGASTKHLDQPEGDAKRPPSDMTFQNKFGKVTGTPAAQRSRVCETCHDKDAKRAMWVGSQHHNADVACDSCHQVHTNRDKVLNKVRQTEVCYSCHKVVRDQNNRPSHHPVAEGKMGCSDCHNVHGSAGPKLVKRDSINATCYTCHAEKRGPFVRQHEPVSDDCMNCHTAHGSTIAGMLKVRPPMLCQQCHTPHVAGAVGALGGQNGVFGAAAPGQISALITANANGKNVVNMWQGRSCMNCHTQVHGSNNPSATNPTPQLMLR